MKENLRLRKDILPRHQNMLPFFLALLMLVLTRPLLGQDTLKQVVHVSLAEALKMGLDNSKVLRLSSARVDAAAADVLQTRDAQLPAAKANLAYSEASLLSGPIHIPGTAHPYALPDFNPFYLGTVSVEQAIFAGHRLRYARQSAQLMVQIASLEKDNDRQGVLLDIINEYYNLFKVGESMRIVDSSLADINDRLDETLKFEKQGLATRNDVLRWQLQQSNTMITRLDLEDNHKDISYDMDLLLGLPVGTDLEVDSTITVDSTLLPLDHYLSLADSSRTDLSTFNYQNQVEEINIRQIKSTELPTIGAAFQMYYINPNYNFFPPAGSLYLVPVTLGLDASWDIGTLWTSKHKINSARVQQLETGIQRDELRDNISSQVNKSYTQFLESLKKIGLLSTAVEQAVENNRIMESKYQNQLASTTDRIDAHTMLYEAQINLELARADAKIAYYSLLKSTGTIQ
jgi:outer membrane protein